MITVKESLDDTAFRNFTKKEFECPLCSHTIIFRSVTIYECDLCRRSIVNVRRLMHDQDYRMNYHAGLVG